MVTHGIGESLMRLRDWPQARNTEYLRKQYTDWQHTVVPCSYLLAIFCCFEVKFLHFQQNVPWPCKTPKSYVAQRKHENLKKFAVSCWCLSWWHSPFFHAHWVQESLKEKVCLVDPAAVSCWRELGVPPSVHLNLAVL